MTRFRATQLARPLLALALCAFVASCTTTPPPRGIENEGIATNDLVRVNPLDIAVMPIENQTGRYDLPLDLMRRKFHTGLVRQRYTPLALDYVDRQVTEASFAPGDLREEGLFRVTITEWDDSAWKTHSRLVISADVYLLAPDRPQVTAALWGGHVTRRLDMQFDRAATSTEGALIEKAVTSFVDGVLGSLPARDPERVPSGPR